VKGDRKMPETGDAPSVRRDSWNGLKQTLEGGMKGTKSPQEFYHREV